MFDVAKVRAQFPIFDRPLPNGKPLVYLDSAASAQKPRSVIDKERECCERYYANAYRGDYQFGVQVDGPSSGAYVFGVWARPNK